MTLEDLREDRAWLIAQVRKEREKRVEELAYEKYVAWERARGRVPIHGAKNFPAAVMINEPFLDEARTEIEKEDSP